MTPPPRIATPKTWAQLEQLAAADGLRLHRTRYGVTVFTTGNLIESAFLTITPGDLDDADQDTVLRRTLEAGLAALRELPR